MMAWPSAWPTGDNKFHCYRSGTQGVEAEGSSCAHLCLFENKEGLQSKRLAASLLWHWRVELPLLKKRTREQGRIP
eukprot:313247-Pelagomonas_calceolata.AAC.2